MKASATINLSIFKVLCVLLLLVMPGLKWVPIYKSMVQPSSGSCIPFRSRLFSRSPNIKSWNLHPLQFSVGREFYTPTALLSPTEHCLHHSQARHMCVLAKGNSDLCCLLAERQQSPGSVLCGYCFSFTFEAIQSGGCK